MNIEFSPIAHANLESIRDYIARFSERSAESTIARILQAIRMLENFPLIGRLGIIKETRELSIAGLPYIVVYEIPNETTIRIIRILHERQEYP